MLLRYQPWNAVREMRNEMNRMLANPLARAEDGSSDVTSGWMPPVDIKEEEARFVISADVPGVGAEAIDVTMENGILTIKGERRLETRSEGDNGFQRTERLRGIFHRRFSLPDAADAEQISAKVSNGVLEIVIPKKSAVQPKRIKVAA